jgi:hypothetical protein
MNIWIREIGKIFLDGKGIEFINQKFEEIKESFLDSLQIE